MKYTKEMPGDHKLQATLHGMSTNFLDELSINESEMSAIIPFADGNARDGVGDVLEIGGIDTSRHQKNPIVLFDHGKAVQLPVALSEHPETKEYGVTLDVLNKKARGKAYFYQRDKDLFNPANYDAWSHVPKPGDHLLFCEQVFDMLAKRFIRAGSIGYQVKQARRISASPNTGTPDGLHLIQVLMLEFSVVVLPANADTVGKMLCDNRLSGKPLSPYLVKSLAQYAPLRKAQLGYEGKAARGRRMTRGEAGLLVPGSARNRPVLDNYNVGDVAQVRDSKDRPNVNTVVGAALQNVDERNRDYAEGQLPEQLPEGSEERTTAYNRFRVRRDASEKHRSMMRGTYDPDTDPDVVGEEEEEQKALAAWRSKGSFKDQERELAQKKEKPPETPEQGRARRIAGHQRVNDILNMEHMRSPESFEDYLGEVPLGDRQNRTNRWLGVPKDQRTEDDYHDPLPPKENKYFDEEEGDIDEREGWNRAFQRQASQDPDQDSGMNWANRHRDRTTAELMQLMDMDNNYRKQEIQKILEQRDQREQKAYIGGDYTPSEHDSNTKKPGNFGQYSNDPKTSLGDAAKRGREGEDISYLGGSEGYRLGGYLQNPATPDDPIVPWVESEPKSISRPALGNSSLGVQIPVPRGNLTPHNIPPAHQRQRLADTKRYDEHYEPEFEPQPDRYKLGNQGTQQDKLSGDREIELGAPNLIPYPQQRHPKQYDVYKQNSVQEYEGKASPRTVRKLNAHTDRVIAAVQSGKISPEEAHEYLRGLSEINHGLLQSDLDSVKVRDEELYGTNQRITDKKSMDRISYMKSLRGMYRVKAAYGEWEDILEESPASGPAKKGRKKKEDAVPADKRKPVAGGRKPAPTKAPVQEQETPAPAPVPVPASLPGPKRARAAKKPAQEAAVPPPVGPGPEAGATEKEGEVAKISGRGFAEPVGKLPGLGGNSFEQNTPSRKQTAQMKVAVVNRKRKLAELRKQGATGGADVLSTTQSVPAQSGVGQVPASPSQQPAQKPETSETAVSKQTGPRRGSQGTLQEVGGKKRTFKARRLTEADYRARADEAIREDTIWKNTLKDEIESRGGVSPESPESEAVWKQREGRRAGRLLPDAFRRQQVAKETNVAFADVPGSDTASTNEASSDINVYRLTKKPGSGEGGSPDRYTRRKLGPEDYIKWDEDTHRREQEAKTKPPPIGEQNSKSLRALYRVKAAPNQYQTQAHSVSDSKLNEQVADEGQGVASDQLGDRPSWLSSVRAMYRDKAKQRKPSAMDQLAQDFQSVTDAHNKAKTDSGNARDVPYNVAPGGGVYLFDHTTASLIDAVGGDQRVGYNQRASEENDRAIANYRERVAAERKQQGKSFIKSTEGALDIAEADTKAMGMDEQEVATKPLNDNLIPGLKRNRRSTTGEALLYIDEKRIAEFREKAKEAGVTISRMSSKEPGRARMLLNGTDKDIDMVAQVFGTAGQTKGEV